MEPIIDHSSSSALRHGRLNVEGLTRDGLRYAFVESQGLIVISPG